MLIICPHCKSTAIIRTSKDMTALTRELRLQCSNVECGHTFVAIVETVRTISPSATPDPLIARQLSGLLPESEPALLTPSLPALTV